MAHVYLGLGSNLGDRRGNLEAAISALGGVAELEARSRIFETDPVHIVEQPMFLNMAVRVATNAAPPALLGAIKAIERRIGRVDGVRWGPRLIDIDILLWEDVVLDAPELAIPHPRLAERRFVLEPLADIGAGACHPVNGRTIADLLAGLPESPMGCVRVIAA